jgi:hypothetical protein
MKLTKSELLEMAATIYNEMLSGSSEAEIMDLLGLDAETFQEARRFMLESRAEQIRGKSREHVYVEYVIEQTGNIRKIDKLLSGLDEQRQYNAVVGAIRLRSDILDKIIVKGQDFGLLHRDPQRKEIVAGVLVADMSDRDLKKAIMGQVKALNELVSTHGDADIMALSPGPLHFGESVPVDVEAPSRKAPEATKTTRAKTSRRHAGRRRVKERT